MSSNTMYMYSFIFIHFLSDSKVHIQHHSKNIEIPLCTKNCYIHTYLYIYIVHTCTYTHKIFFLLDTQT